MLCKVTKKLSSAKEERYICKKDIDVYENTANSLSVANTNGSRVTASDIADAKLQQFFKIANESSKIIDKKGEPLVVYKRI